MAEQLTDNAEALRLFFTEDIYLVNAENVILPAEEVAVQSATVIVADQPAAITLPKAAPVTAPAEIIFKYLGKNQKNVLILVNDPENEVSTERGRELLRNIVKAIQLSANDFALLNYSAFQQARFEQLTGYFSSKLVLAFGVTSSELGLAGHPRNVLVSESGAQLIFSGNLDLLAENQEEKKILWRCLKQLSI